MQRNLRHVWCVMAALALASCTESFKPDVSTETGNPPVIDSDLVALVVTRDEVHVRGEAGAVTPPKGEVEITIVRNQAVTSGPVEDDGSFDVEVDATLDDVFEVRAVLGEERSPAVIVVRGGAQIGEGDGGTLSCEQRVDLAGMAFDEAAASADKSCDTVDDCMPIWEGTGCYPGCNHGYASEAGIASIGAAVESLNNGLCDGFEDDCGPVLALPCVGPLPALCENGQCIQDENPGGGCTNCLSEDVSWRVTGAGILPAEPNPERYTLSNCNELERTTMDGDLLCTASVPQCAGPSTGISIASLKTALENEDVVAALAEGGTHGEPEESSGFVYEITVGDKTIVYRTCAGADAGATCQPSDGLEELRGLLDRIRSENTCPNVDCTSDFDPGPTDGAQTVWWHDPGSGSCITQTYGLTGGNGNRYASLEECETACPPPMSQAECKLGRVFKTMCFECGPVGTCANPQGTCALQCSDDQDCEGLRHSNESASYICTAEEGICMAQLFCL